jgi:hypothetical protein
MQLRAFFQKMNSMNFKPKVNQLEQLRIDFDEGLPNMIRSKKDYVGPTNNKRL